MAKKYSEGPNKSKVSSTYQATAPDGTVFKKKSFIVHSDTAYIAVYESINGGYAASAVTSKPMNWGTQIFIPAIKIK